MADRSVWFAWSAPEAGTLYVTIGAGGRSEPGSTTNAAIFGPFPAAPDGPPDLDELRWCVNGVGNPYTLTQDVDGGLYLIQLSAVSAAETRASIRVDFDRAPAQEAP